MKKITGLLFLLLFSSNSFAQVAWTDYLAGVPASFQGPGAAVGQIQLDGRFIGVQVRGQIAAVQTSGNFNFFVPPQTYTSTSVPNPPLAGETIAFNQVGSINVSFSAFVSNVVLSVFNLPPTGLDFTQDFTILSFGEGFFGPGEPLRREIVDGRFRLVGEGGNGTLQFFGDASNFSFVNLSASEAGEFAGFTVGIPVPEPTYLFLVSFVFFFLLRFVYLEQRNWSKVGGRLAVR